MDKGGQSAGSLTKKVKKITNDNRLLWRHGAEVPIPALGTSYMFAKVRQGSKSLGGLSFSGTARSGTFAKVR
jgi:hypothetical protein